MTRRDDKLQRWIDLLADLLNHRYGRTFDQLRGSVPGYAAGSQTAVARMFERDKDDLRALGVPIETTDPSEEDGEHQRYCIDRRELYLPVLAIVASERARQLPPAGYRNLPTLTFEPDELRALADGVSRAIAVEDAGIAADARAALKKLAFDFPLDSILTERQDAVFTPAEPATAAQIRLLGQALMRLKRVTFTYRSMTRDATEPRTVEPYGLFFASRHWYLAARDVDANALRKFRVSRMREIVANAKAPQTADYMIPESFRLAEHAVDRAAWELGDGDALEAVVEFPGASGATNAALRAGAPSSRGDLYRVFQVRRLDTFARWVLSFAGEAVPVSPPALIAEYKTIARAALGLYGDRP